MDVMLPPIEASPEEITKALFPPRLIKSEILDQARKVRNKSWQNNPVIPSWVDLETVDLDRFYTRPLVARKCYNALINIMNQDHANPSQYKFVDPSAGDGVFYDLLPSDRRIGIEIVPSRNDFECHDFLDWKPHMLSLIHI